MISYLWRIVARFLARPRVTEWLIRRAMRTPYSPIIKDGEIYMQRYWLFNPYPDNGASGRDRPRWQFPISIRIHHILLPDRDRDMHDHPWNARTIILRGAYVETRLEHCYGANHEMGYVRRPGDTATLEFGEFHKITDVTLGGVWTMFITGRYQGTWGFDVDGVKVPWRRYLGLEPKP